jgi:hypothetical protein
MKTNYNMFWATVRFFSATTRWHDLNTIDYLEKNYGWNIESGYTLRNKLPSDISEKEKNRQLNKNIFQSIKNSDLVVAHLYPYSQGLAIEIKVAYDNNVPILGWYDSSRYWIQSRSKHETIYKGQFEKMKVTGLPLSEMVIDMIDVIKYVGKGKPKGISSEELAEIIHKEAIEILTKK